ncbi:YfbU family protein [Azotobacter chroococcum]|uniref:YfbU family protein n=1 Tax=Azotobacter chroococcum TaxID=353 RepID=A0AAQ0BZF8_9GAMM|nr:YfbU family protein [Azotobacter chroococcum]QQE88106.1 YfbU family protein [Azotobacter chroococcum]
MLVPQQNKNKDEVEMEFSNQQKLIITLLTDIHAHLGIDNSVDPLFVRRMVQGGHGWALGWAYPGLFEDGIEAPEAVTFVAEVLTMWEAIEETYAGFDQARKDQLAELAPAFGRDPRFCGFDGNHEADLRGIVHILVDDLGRWPAFRGRDTDSHRILADGYRRMLEVYARIADSGPESRLSVEALAEILNAKIIPKSGMELDANVLRWA